MKEAVIYSVAGYIFDAFISITNSSSVSVTSHPVETGANISDHTYENPKVVRMQIGVSDATLGDYNFKLSDTSRAKNAYNALRDIQKKRLPISVFTKYESYENMILTDMEVKDDADGFESLSADITLREVIPVTLKTAKISIDQQATDTYNLGVNEVNNLDPSERMSLLYMLGQSFGFIGG